MSFKNCTEKSIEYPKLKKMRIQLENVNLIRKFNLKMEIKVYLEIGKKVYENKGNWEIKKIDKWQRKKSVLKLERN